MTEEKKEGSCCSSSHGSKCCGVKSLIVKLLILGLVFTAGMMFAKNCPLGGKTCPMSVAK